MYGKVSVLLVEDEEEVLKDIKYDLKQYGLHCMAADGEIQAIRLIDNGFRPDAALIDYTLSRSRKKYPFDVESKGLTGGLALARFVRKQTDGRCRIILTTALDECRSSAQSAGAWGYYQKPRRGPDDWSLIGKMLSLGSLKDNEIDQPTVNIKSELFRRSLER